MSETKSTGATKERRPRKARHVKVSIPHLQTIDLRTRAGKLAIRVRNEIADDLGGMSALTAMQRELVDRAVVLSCLLNAQEASWLSGEGIEPGQYSTLCNCQNRILSSLGLKRKRKAVEVSFRDVAYEDAVAA